MKDVLRTADIRRTTKETDIAVHAEIDGKGDASSDTRVSFLDHLIESFGKHSMMNLSVKAKSLDGIKHHLIEDTAIAIGAAVNDALGDRAGIVRFGHASVPMDESLAEAAVDMVKRTYCSIEMPIENDVEDVSQEDLLHFFRSLLSNLNCCVHLAVRYGENDHHKAEAAIKSLAVAFRCAVSPDPLQSGIPSTKGAM